MASIEFLGHHNEMVEVTGNVTLDGNDIGVVQNVTASATITLPAVAAIHDFLIRVGKPGITVTISPNSSDKIAGYTAANSGVGADDKDLIFTNQPAGSGVHLRGGSADGVCIARLLGEPTFQS